MLLAPPPSKAQDQIGDIVSSSVACPTAGIAGGFCYALTITCPEIQDYTAYLKVLKPPKVVGLALLGTGGEGDSLYEQYTYGSTTVNNLYDAGYTVAQLTWGSPFVTHAAQPHQGWQELTNGAGLRKAACRYATIAKWAKHHLQSATVPQPFCASGNSAGAAVIGYGLAHYRIASFLNFALLTSGPPFTRLDWACDSSQPSALAYCSNVHTGMVVGVPNAIADIDPAYQPTYSAACSSAEQTRSKALDGIFYPDSITSADGVMNYGSTLVEFLYGGKDGSSALRQGEYYRQHITSPTFAACVPDAGHSLGDTLDAAEQVASDLIAHCGGEQ